MDQAEASRMFDAGPHRRGGRVAIAALLVGMAAGGLLSTRHSPTPSAALGTVDFSRDHGILPLGVKVSLAQAENEASFHIYRPDVSAASDSSIRAVYIQTLKDESDSTIDEVAIDYESGVLLTLTAADASLAKDPGAFYAARAAEGPGRSIESLDGTTALLINANVEGPDPPSVSLVLGGIEVTLYGEYGDVDVSTLVAAAQSVE